MTRSPGPILPQGFADTVIEAAGMMVVCVDLNGIIIMLNPAAERMTGYARADLVGRDWLDTLVPGAWSSRVREEFRQTLDAAEARDFESPMLTASGEMRHVRWQSAALREEGRAVGVVFCGQDVTLRYRAQEQARVKDAHFRLLADNVSDVIWTMDLSGRFTYFSPSIERMFGFTQEEALQQTIEDKLAPASAALIRERQKTLFSAIALGEPVVPERVELEHLRKDGSTIWVELTCQTMLDSGGQVTGLIGVIRDISERKRVEDELRRTNEMLQAIIEASPVALFALDMNLEVLMWSPAAERIFGWTAEEVVGHGYPLVPPERSGEIGATLEEVARQGKILSGVDRVRRRKDGSLVDVSLSIAPLRDAAGQVIGGVGAFVDITESKRAKEELEWEKAFSETALESLPGIFYLYRVDETSLENCRLVRFNRDHATKTGYSTEELRGMRVRDWFDEAAWQHVAASLVRLIEQNETRVQVDVTMKDGRKVPYELTGRSFRVGGELYFAGVGTDVSDYVRAREALQESEDRFRGIMEQSTFSTMILSPDGTVLDINEACVQLWGVGREKARAYRILADQQLERLGVIPLVKRALSGERISMPPLEYDLSATLGQGRRKIVLGEFYPIRDAHGVIRYIILIHQDVTERRRAEEELRHANELLQGIVEASPLALMALDSDRNVIMWSPAAERIFGWTAGEVLGRRYALAPEGRFDEVDTAFEQVLRGATISGEQRVRQRKDGTLVDVGLSVAPMHDAAGARVGVVAILEDITDRKRAEEELRRTNETLQAIIQASPAAIFVLDPDQKVLMWSPAAEKLFGWTAEELMGRPYPLAPPGREQEVWDATRNVIQQGRTFSGQDRVRQRKDGSLIDVSLSVAPLYDAEGRVMGGMGIMVDITDRKRAEEELRRTNETLQAIIQASPVAIFVVDPDQNVLMWSPAAEKMFGWTAEELMGRPYPLAPPGHEHEVREAIDAVVKPGGTLIGVDRVRQRKDGSLVDVSLSIASLRDPDGGAIGGLGVMVDITDRKRAENALRERERRAREQNEILLRVMTSGALFGEDLDGAIRMLTETCSELLGTERVSVWTYDEDYADIRCHDLYLRGERRHEAGQTLNSSQFPTYTQSLRQGVAVAVEDVYADPRTREIPLSYFKDANIRSLLDAPVWINKRMGGILSFEVAGRQRSWSQEDERVATTIAALLSLCFEAYERRRAEEKVRQTTELLQAIVKSSPLAVVVIDFEGNVVMWSPAAESIFGYTADEVIGHPYPIVSPEQWTEVTDAMARVRAGDVVHSEARTRRRKDGAVIDTALSGGVLRDSAGHEIGIVAILEDVTERKRAQDALVWEKTFTDALLQSLPGNCYLYRVDENSPEDCRLVRFNQDLAIKTGHTAEEVLNMRLRDWFDEASWQRMSTALVTLMERNEARVQTNLTMKDGRQVPYDFTARCFRMGNELYFAGVSIDVSDYLRTQAALRESEERFRLAMEATSDGLWDWDIATDNGYFSPGYYRMLGYEPDEFATTGQAWGERIHPEDRERTLAANADCIENRKEAFEVEFRMQTKDNQWKWILGRGKTVSRGPDGRALRMIGTHVDISDRKRAEETLREREQRYRSLFEGAQDAILILDQQHVVECNTGALEVFGCNREEIVGHFINDFMPPVQPDGRSSAEAAAGNGLAALAGTPQRFEFRHLRADGTAFDADVSLSRIDIGQGTILQAIVRDITDRKRAEAELQRNVAEIERFNRLAIGREQRILELKRQVNELNAALGQAMPYQMSDESVVPPESAVEEAPAVTDVESEATSLPGLDLDDLLDLDQMQRLLDSFSDASGVATAIVDPTGRILVGSGWRRICTDYHRVNERTRAKCTESDTVLASQLEAEKPFSLYLCRNGLMDAASPVIIEGRHVANVFVGQFLQSPPDEAYFRAQAAEYGFDEEDYLEALREVPVVTPRRLENMLQFMTRYARLMVEIGLSRARDKASQVHLADQARTLNVMVRELRLQREAALSLAEDANEARQNAERVREALRESEEKLRTILDLSPLPISWADSQRRIEFWNRKALELFGYDAEEISTVDDWFAHAYPDAECRAHAVGRWNDAVARGREAGGEIKPGDLDATCKDGTVRTVEVFGSFFGERIVVIFNDITDRKRAEAALRLNEARLEALVELNQMRDIPLEEMTQYTMDQAVRLTQSRLGYIAFVNEAQDVLTLYAWSRAAMQECMIQDRPLVYPLEATGLWGEALRQRQPIITNDYAAPNPWKRGYPEGHVALTRHMNVPITDGDRVVIVAGVGNKETDYDQADVRQLTLLMSGMWRILQRARAEQGLRDSEEAFRALFEECPFVVVVNDIETGQYVSVNQQFTERLGIRREDAIGKTAFELGLVHDPGYFPRRRDRLLREGHIDQEEILIDNPLHGQTWVLASSRIIRLRGQSCALTAFQDITDRKQAEEALRQSERRLSLAVSATADAIWEWNAQTGEVYFSPRWYEMLGYRDQELPMVIETWRQLCHLEDYQATADLLQEVARLSRSTGCTAEFRMRAKDGSWVWVQGRCNVVEWNAEGKALLVSGANTDITERKRNEEELRRHRDHLETLVAERTAQLQAANRDLSEFAYVVSHDLKAPLRAVSQLAHWIAEDYATVLDDEGKTKLELMRGRITRMYNLIDGILEYSRIGRLEGKPEAVNLDTLVREVIEVLDPPAHIQVRVETPLPTVTANRTRMEQLFQNLIGNAIKFMDKPVGLVTVACEEAGDFWRFRVTDNGPGIEPKYHEKVFGIFQTLVARDRQESTGIGLTLVKKIVELYHGEITLISEPGQGATFSFTLPR